MDPAVPDLTDADLTALALGADPDPHLGDDAVSLWELTGDPQAGPLPSWYMPAPMRAPRFSGWRMWVVRSGVVSIVASFVVINAAGLCNTYGQIHL